MKAFIGSMEGRSGRNALIAVIAGFGALVVAVAAVAWGIVAQQRLNAWVVHTYEVETALTQFRFLAERIEVTRRGHLLQPDPRFLRGFQQARDEMPVVLDQIQRLTADNPQQQTRVENLRRIAQSQIDTVARTFVPDAANAIRSDGESLFDDGSFAAVRESRALSLEMVEEERRLLGERQAADRRSLVLIFVVLGVAALVLLIVAAGTIWLVRRNLLDLKSSRDNLADLNENLEEAVATRTSDLQRANGEIQRFAYIVSHDLRSPLVNVMGFTSELDAVTSKVADLVDKAETDAPALVSEDVKLAVREDLPEAIGFIRSSTQKMDRLINAILRLSREGRRVITPEPLDVNAIVDGVAASVAHRAGETGAEISIDPKLPPIVSDRVALEQIFSNLVENAMKYAEPGRAVRVGVRGRTEPGRVVYDVADNGRGIDPRDHDRIFDLFRRSGAQDQPGEGIGLAHVRALAYRLGGNISCTSAIGEGSTFTLSLPPNYKPRKEA